MTIPSSADEVIQSLSLALSPDPTSRSQSLSHLQNWSTLPGYYLTLTQIFTEPRIDRQVRLQAAVQFKNGVDRYWRKSANHAIPIEEKKQIRPRLLAMVNEPDRTLSKNVALAIAKIARLDFGTEWNELPETLLSSLQSSSSLLTVHRSLLFLHATLKILSSNRMMKGRSLMSQLAQYLFNPLRDLHATILASAVERLKRDGFLTVSGEDAGGETEEIECALLTFKCLRYLIIYGYRDPSEDEEVRAFYQTTIPTLTSLLQLRLSILTTSPPPHATPRLISLTKQIISYGKLYKATISTLDRGAEKFERMAIVNNVVETYWEVVRGACSVGIEKTIDDPTCLYPTRLLVPSLLLLKSTTSGWDGTSPLSIPLEFVKEFAQLLVTKMLPMRIEDLTKWDEDPEEWMNEEEMDRTEFELRPCAEFVLGGLLGGYKEDLGPILASYLRDPKISNPPDLETLLLKEAVYTAVGRNVSELSEAIDYNEWLKETLVRECSGTDPLNRIIRRRIASLLGNIVNEDLASTSRPLIYSLVIHLLQRNESTDPAIRLTAARSLRKCCDSWGFEKEVFLPYLGNAIDEIVQLLGEVELSDSLMRLNQTLGILIDHVGDSISPYAPQLATILGTLWVGAQDAHFQTSVLVTFTRLAEALNEQSHALLPQACPIIQASVDPTHPAHVYLQEDGVELWQILLRRSNTLTPDLLALLPLLMNLLSFGTDILPRCLAIFESYLLLDAAQVLEFSVSTFFHSISTLLEGLRFESVKTILHTFNTIFQIAPASVWATSLDESGCFARMLNTISEQDNLIVTKYLCSIARIILSSPESFQYLIASTASRTNSSPDQLLSLVLGQFIDRLDNMSQGGQRKIVALALANLVVSQDPLVLSKLPDLVALWSGVMAQTEENEEGDAELYHVPDDYTSDIDVDYTETLETQRRAALSMRDPITTHKLSTFIGGKLSEAQQLNGGSETFQSQWLSRVDPIVVEELVKRLEGQLKG